MTSANNALAHALRLRFGLAQTEPSAAQLAEIKQALAKRLDDTYRLSHEDIREIVQQFCPSAGTYSYKGADHSDLMTLLRLAMKVPST